MYSTSGSSGSSTTSVTAKAGAASPRSAKASSRMCSSRSDRFRPLAIGEVPRQVEVLALHAGLAQGPEDVLHGVALVLDDGQIGRVGCPGGPGRRARVRAPRRRRPPGCAGRPRSGGPPGSWCRGGRTGAGPSSASTPASSSAHTGQRSPVSASTTTTGESSASESGTSVMAGRPDASRSRPGATVSRAVPGLKPSLRFHSVGSVTTSSSLAGMPTSGKDDEEARCRCRRPRR